MSIERDTLVVVDIESTCWENEKAPSGEISEIIEIGVCTLDIASGEPAKKGVFSLNPQCQKSAHFVHS